MCERSFVEVLASARIVVMVGQHIDLSPGQERPDAEQSAGKQAEAGQKSECAATAPRPQAFLLFCDISLIRGLGNIRKLNRHSYMNTKINTKARDVQSIEKEK